MKKLVFGIALLAAVATTMVKAQSVELVKVSSFNTGYVTGSYDEYSSRGVKIGDKILINDAYSVLNMDSKPDGTGYKYTISSKSNLALCIYDADRNEHCDYQNLSVLRIDTGASDYSYPTKTILQYKGSKLPSVNLLTMTGLTNGGSRYISYDPYFSGYISNTGTIVDILGERLFINSINPTNRYTNYMDPNLGVYTDSQDIYKANQNVSVYTTKYQGFGLSSLTKGELADLINGNTGVSVSQNLQYDPNFANYFMEQKDQTVIATQNLKLNNTNLTWIKPQGSSYNQDIYTNAKKDFNTSLNISLAGYMGDITQYEKFMNTNMYYNPESIITKSTFTDKNNKNWTIIKNIMKYDNTRMSPYDSMARSTGLTEQNYSVLYYALSAINNNLVTININTISTGNDNGLSMIQDAINNTTIKKNISFSMPKELAINIIKPQDSNYFITRMGDSQYPQYNLSHTSSTGGNIYIYKNQYTNVKAYIKGQEKDYSYMINSNNSPIYIKNTKYENVNQFDILLPVKESDGTDSTISMSTTVTTKSEIEDIKKLLDKSLYTTVKIIKTKKNIKEFDKNVVNYFKNLK